MPTPLTISFCRLALLPTEVSLTDGARQQGMWLPLLLQTGEGVQKCAKPPRGALPVKHSVTTAKSYGS